MCGIAGIMSRNKLESAQIIGMLSRIKHRGPDYQNHIKLFGGSTWLGHTRLSIIDLSDAANQPMSNDDGSLLLTYNGEVYNYIELRDGLKKKGYLFRTNSDTEVILAAYREWGAECVNHLNGMFAFLLVDTVKRSFFAVRDRYGVKPLYYWKSLNTSTLYFASEIKEFVDLPDWNPQMNGQRAYDYLAFGLTDHTNETLFKDVFQIRGGEYAFGKLENPTGSLEVRKWYNPPTSTLRISEQEASEQFKSLFFDSVKLRLRSDVSVGSCLSGGLDSSSIVCAVNDLLRENGNTASQKTISALAKGTPHDESKYIDIVLNERKIDGYFVDPSPEELWKIQNKLIWHQDEPFGSTSIYAEWCVFQKAGENNLIVMLDGQGADELLAGYKRFFLPYYSQLFTSLHWKRLAEEVRYAKEYHGYSWKTVAKGILKTTLPTGIISRGQSFRSSNGVAEWYSVDRIGARREMPRFYGDERAKSLGELSDQLFFYNNMPMLLRYEDRNSMAHSVESRLPFLDYRLVEFVQSLPDNYKISHGRTKAVLRNSMKGVIPEQIQNRMDKIGFETPEEKWEREHSQEFRKMIGDSIEKTDGIINNSALEYFDRVIAGGKLDFAIWRMINFGIWYDMFINGNQSIVNCTHSLGESSW